MKYKETSVPSPHLRHLFMEWYHSSPQGQTLRDSEASYLLNSLQLTYCQRILQVGHLGMESRYVGEEFSRNYALIVDGADIVASQANTVRAKLDEWPIACESVDMLILPHLVEFEANPQRLLGEAERVLKPEGRLLILGFNPWNPQVLLRHRQQTGDPWNTHFVSCFQVMEWLNLLKFEAEFSAGFGLPTSRAFFEPQSAWLKPVACLTAAYAVKAVKRTWTPTPLVKQAWLGMPGLVPGQAMVPPLIMRKDQ